MDGRGGGATTAIIIVPPIGVTALAWTGGMALALWTVIWVPPAARRPPAPQARQAATEAARRPMPRRRRATRPTVRVAPPPRTPLPGSTTCHCAPRRDLTLLVAGLLAGVALLFRPDLVIALGLPLGVLFLFAFDCPLRWLLIGGAVGVSPYLLHLVFAGPKEAPSRAWCSSRSSTCGPGAGCRSRRRPTTSPSFLNRAYALREFPWPLPEPSMTMQVGVFFWSLVAVCLVLLVMAV